MPGVSRLRMVLATLSVSTKGASVSVLSSPYPTLVVRHGESPYGRLRGDVDWLLQGLPAEVSHSSVIYVDSRPRPVKKSVTGQTRGDWWARLVSSM